MLANPPLREELEEGLGDDGRQGRDARPALQGERDPAWAPIREPRWEHVVSLVAVAYANRPQTNQFSSKAVLRKI